MAALHNRSSVVAKLGRRRAVTILGAPELRSQGEEEPGSSVTCTSKYLVIRILNIKHWNGSERVRDNMDLGWHVTR